MKKPLISFYENTESGYSTYKQRRITLNITRIGGFLYGIINSTECDSVFANEYVKYEQYRDSKIKISTFVADNFMNTFGSPLSMDTIIGIVDETTELEKKRSK